MSMTLRPSKSLFSGTVHVLGDSHASTSFTSQSQPFQSYAPEPLVPDCLCERFSFARSTRNGPHSVPFVVHWLPGRTMHRVGRDGMPGLDLRAHGVGERDAVVMLFGWIDAESHVETQLLLGRRFDEVIERLLTRYTATIDENTRHLRHLRVVLMAICPLWRGASINDPVSCEAVNALNVGMELACKTSNYLFFDPWSEYKDSNGELRDSVTGDGFHISVSCNVSIKRQLLELLST